jgi:hypothetical protein
MFLRSLIAAILLMIMATPSFAQALRWQSEGWRTDFSKTSIDFAEILSGGPRKDGIPPIDNPVFVGVDEPSALTDRDPVIGLSINGDARAYPLRIMTWHEIVNDVVGDTPVAVTYCPLCNAAIVFEARIDGKAATFGTTGKLRKSDLIMYDRESESWWQQFVGEAMVGLHTGKKLRLVPARLESWKEFKGRHPDGRVLVPNNPQLRNYGRNPYVNYDIATTPFLYNGSMPEGIPAMARVVVVRRENEDPIVLALEKLQTASSMSMEGFRIEWQIGQASALHAGTISKGRDVGTVSVIRLADGAPVAYDVTFAFVAHAFHPDVTIRQ